MEHNLGIGSRIKHPQYGDGVVINFTSSTLNVTFISSGLKEIPNTDEFEVIDEMVPDTDLVSAYDLERSLTEILKKWGDFTETVPLGEKWTGGTMILQPGRKDLAVKEIPIEQFFHKIVMLRDRLRTLEQKVNSSKGLDDETKVDIQQYITRCYGSLTTFNVFFKYPHDNFVGDRSKKD